MLDSLRKQIIPKIITRYKATPKRHLVIGLVIGVVLISVIVVVWPRYITFSYQHQVCVAQPQLLPGLLRSSSDKFVLQPHQEVKIGQFALVAGGVCLKPTAAPQAGEYTAMLSPLGLQFLGKRFTIKVEAPPQASVVKLGQPIPVSRALTIPLSTPDAVFTYRAMFGDKVLPCQNKQAQISCDVPKIDLDQGAKYEFQLERLFNGKKIATVVTRSITTLSATTVQASSIKPGETVFARPKSLEFQVDKPITDATAALIKIDGDKRETIKVEAKTNDKTVVVTWLDDLPREAVYELALTKVNATDGSNLIDPFVVPFKTSGGPKVKAVSIGTSRVPMGATAVITFDQPLSEKQDLSKVVTASGGATVNSRKANQLFISFASVPKCGDVAMRITNDLQSNYDVGGGTGWQYTTRTICHTIGSIGASVRGRAISAYYFGSGPNTVIYTGAIHGSEASTRALMLRWTDDLESNPRAIPADKTVIVVPAINPDGIASGSRTNANNVDLNRNFGTSDWKKDITTVSNAPFPGGGGNEPMSEPETRAIAGLVSRTRPQLVLSYHSIGGVVAANQAGISGSRASSYTGLSGYGNATGATGSVFEYSVSGTADDYYGEKLGVASLLIELGSHTYHQFERNQKAMWAMLK